MRLTIHACTFLVSIFLLCGSPFAGSIEFYVSTSGNDSWSGKLPEANIANTDGPFATLEKARDTIRELRKNGPFPMGAIIISIRGGEYTFTKTFKLTAVDSGYPHAPMVWQAYPGEKVRFIGGKRITGFEPLREKSALKRINKSCHKKVLQADLKSLGISDYGTLNPESGKRMELFFKEKFMQLARYPNEGWLKIADVPQTGTLVFEGVKPHIRDGVIAGRHYGRFTYDGDRPDKWAESDNIWMHGYWAWDWSDSYQRIDRIDKKKKEIYPAEPHHHYGYCKRQRYYFLNILEELDSPGEWYVDRTKGMLYFWPPSPVGEGEVFVSTLEDLMISLEDVSNVVIRGIDFKVSRGSAVTIKRGQNNIIGGCSFSNFGQAIVTIDGGMGNGITGCDMYDSAREGVYLSGGDRKTLTPAGNYATNNNLYRLAQIVRGDRFAWILGVGNLFSHNYLHDAYFEVLYFKGNEHCIEYNEFARTLSETNDAGAIHTGRNPSEQGTVIRYNYFHHTGGDLGWGTNSVYFDDGCCGDIVFGNVFYKAGLPGGAKMGAMFINGGRYNIMDNNIFIDCPQAFNESPWSQEVWKDFWSQEPWHSWLYVDVDITRPPYSERYPWMTNVMDDTRPNILSRNLVYKCNTFRDRGSQELVDNLVTDEAPGFVDEAKGNYMLRDDSWVYKKIPGFQKIPFDKIGLYKDEYRKELPKER